MHRHRLFLILAFLSFTLSTLADPIGDMLGRILPSNGDAAKFSWDITGGDTQQFTLSCDGTRVSVSGSDYIAIATGINWYFQHYAGIDISWNAPTAQLPTALPRCDAETHTASVPWRYYLNFCTHSYSMAFWGWERWQQEIDWMALHGVNLPLAIVGMEAVWREVLQNTYGYSSLDDVNTFICGSAYYGWFFMNNITAWGGPQPASWYSQRQALARQIFQRMTDFGMSPVVPGYVGMVPADFLSRADASKVSQWTADDIVDGGRWCSFTRPAFVNNTELLREFAAKYYAAFTTLYGDVCTPHHWAIDPFHEGGVPAGVTNAQASVEAMWTALQTYDPQAVWVAQHWQDNPKPIVTHTIPRGRLIILDLHGDQYADTECSGHHTTGEGLPHEWVWGQVSNFGGNVGLFGRMERLINCFYAARNAKADNNLVGIGALPEGIENNPMLYDLLYALPWTNTDYTPSTWLNDYVSMRYGTKIRHSSLVTRHSSLVTRHSSLSSAWAHIAASGIYDCPNDNQQGTTESVLLMRPALTPTTVSTWAGSTWYWDAAELRAALRDMLAVSDAYAALPKDNNAANNYRYDLVELTRQVLADHGKQLLDEIHDSSFLKGQASQSAERVTQDSSLVTRHSSLVTRFLELILDQDRLLGTRAELRLGRWTAAARALGTTPAESDLYERNARMLLTTWGDRPQCETGGLHDYANREWQGLLAAYYYPRWQAFFRNSGTAQAWFDDFEWPFATGAAPAFGTFSPDPEGDEIELAKTLYDKYFHDIAQ